MWRLWAFRHKLALRIVEFIRRRIVPDGSSLKYALKEAALMRVNEVRWQEIKKERGCYYARAGKLPEV